MYCFSQDGIEVVDLRYKQSNPSPKSRARRGKTVLRQPGSIIGIVVHQTACEFGVSRRAVAAADGDRDLAQQMRALRVANHMMAYREGWAVIANDFHRYIYHGNRFNAYSLGLEIEGLYSGVVDNPDTAPDEADRSTWGGKPQEVTDLLVATACAALHYMIIDGRAMGMPLRYIWAHRQSSANRRSDPGEEIWRRIVLEYAVPELGLITQPTHIVGNGKSIPQEWDPQGVGKY
jgi:hypothetical protein